MTPPRAPLIETVGLSKHYAVRAGSLFRRHQLALRAVDNVAIRIHPGETLGLVGESGCGKSTLGRLLIRLIEPSDGNILFEEQDITRLSGKALRARRRAMQIIFQDPYGALDPRLSVEHIIAEPLLIHGVGAAEAKRIVARFAFSDAQRRHVDSLLDQWRRESRSDAAADDLDPPGTA